MSAQIDALTGAIIGKARIVASIFTSGFRPKGFRGHVELSAGSYQCGCGAVIFATDRKAKRHHPKGHKKQSPPTGTESA